jgi:hypothetical protein
VADCVKITSICFQYKVRYVRELLCTFLLIHKETTEKLTVAKACDSIVIAMKRKGKDTFRTATVFCLMSYCNKISSYNTRLAHRNLPAHFIYLRLLALAGTWRSLTFGNRGVACSIFWNLFLTARRNSTILDTRDCVTLWLYKRSTRLQRAVFRTFIRVYSLFKSEQLNANIKLTLHKVLIRSVMTYACTAW